MDSREKKVPKAVAIAVIAAVIAGGWFLAHTFPAKVPVEQHAAAPAGSH